ncbi:hypothetical protein RI129_009782 [Pyrocoelia pectoralis]|uniref:Uncharacterized protein n=1 Tax=Pyrocoelia pectoralis TaxID=417401 RepID=A0AAN7V2V9_9COLE
MNELFNSTDGQAKCDSSIPNKSSCVTNEQSEPNKLKSAPEVPCRRSARISAAKENTTLLNVSSYEYLISTSFNKKNRKPRASSTKRKTTKKVINPCDCQDKFSMSSRKLKPFSNFNSNNTSSTDQELDQYQKDEVTANLAHGSNDKTVTDKKDKVEDSDEIFKCIKMKTESKTNNDLKMKIKKCYKKSKKKESNSDLNEVTNDIGGLPKTGVQNEVGKKRKRETCRKQFRHKDITLYKLGSGPEKGINSKKQDIQKLFNKFLTNTDGASTEVTVPPPIGENDMSNFIHCVVKVGSYVDEKTTNDNKQLETYAEHTKRLRKSVQEETATKIDRISIPELRICDELPKVSIQLSELKKDKPETGKHNLPIRIPERRSSIAQPLRSPGFSKKQSNGSTANKTELNFSVDNIVENIVATPTDHNGNCKQGDILHRPYQSVENIKNKLSTEGRSLQIGSNSIDKKTDEPSIGLLKRCSGITDPLKYKENHLPPKKGLIKNSNESFIERHTSLSAPKLVRQENQKSPSPTVSNESTYNLTHFTPDSNSNLGPNTSTHSATINVLQSMPLLDVSDERMGDKVSPKLLTPIDTSFSPKNLKRKLSPSEEDNATSTKYFRENSSPSYNFPYSNIPLYNFIPTLSEYNRYLQKYPLHVPFRAPDLSPPILTPYDSYNTQSAHLSNFPPSSLYNYDYVKTLLNLSKPRLPTNYPPALNSIVNPSERITKSASPIITLNVNTQATEIVAEPVTSTAILTIPEVRFTAKKTPSPSTEETNDSEDLNAQTLSKIIGKEDLTVTKLSTNYVSTNSSFLEVAKKDDMKINEHTVISDATKHDSNHVPAPNMEILRQELSKPITPTKSLSPQVKCLPKETNQLNKFIEPISPASKTPPPYVISDSETETDNETELEENKSNVALNLTKDTPVVQNSSTKIVPSTSSFEEKRLAHTLNTLTFVVNEIIDKTGSNMPKEDKDMLHKLLKGVRQNFIFTAPNSENLPKVSVKQEAVIEIISSDSENSNDSNVDIQQTLDLSTQSSSSVQGVNSQTSSMESVTPTKHNSAKSEDVNTDSSLASNNNCGPVNLISPKSQVHKNASSHLKDEDNCLTNNLQEMAKTVQNEEVCGIDLSLRGKNTKDVPLMTEVNNNEEQQTVKTVTDNPCIEVTKKVTPCENIEPLQSHPSTVTGVAAETTTAASGSNIDLNTPKLITAAQKTQNNFLNPRPIIARRASYHPSSATSKAYPNILYKNTTYHNKSGNIELPTPPQQSTYYKNPNLQIDPPNLTISQPQNSTHPSNLSTSLMKTFVCEYLRGGNNEKPISYLHPASSIPKTCTSHAITQNNVNGKGPHPIDANVQAMQSLQNYTNSAYQAWQDEVRRHRLTTVPAQHGTTQFYNKPRNEPTPNVRIRETRPNLNLNKTNYNMSNPYTKNSRVTQGDSNHPYPANVSEHYYAAYGKRVNINEPIQGPKNVSNVPKNQTINKVNGLHYPYGAVKTSTDYRSPCVNYTNFGRGGTQAKPYPNHSPPNIHPTKSLSASNQKQIPVYPTHPFPEINSKSSDSFMNKSGRLRETVFNDNASPDYGYYSQQTKTTTVDSAQYGSYPQNIENRRTSASSQHSSISTLDNPFSEYLQTNSNSSSTTSITSTNNNLENTSQQSFTQILQSKDQAKLAKILPKLQTSDQPLTPEQYVREMSILETDGCPKQLLEFYTYVTKKQIASNQRPIGFCIFLEFQNAGKLTVFEDAFKLYTEKRQTEKIALKDT